MTLEVVHRNENLAQESGFEFMAPISGARFWSVCHGPENLLRFDEVTSVSWWSGFLGHRVIAPVPTPCQVVCFVPSGAQCSHSVYSLLCLILVAETFDDSSRR